MEGCLFADSLSLRAVRHRVGLLLWTVNLLNTSPESRRDGEVYRERFNVRSNIIWFSKFRQSGKRQCVNGLDLKWKLAWLSICALSSACWFRNRNMYNGVYLRIEGLDAVSVR